MSEKTPLIPEQKQPPYGKFCGHRLRNCQRNRSSVCSVGIVVVRDGEIVDKYYSLIQPTPNFYTRFTTAVHGLTMEDTGDARQFPQVWAELSVHLPEDFPLVAHNSPFDESCLRAVFEPTRWTIRNIPSIAPVVPLVAHSEGCCPIINSTRWQNAAVFTSKITTTRWPMPRLVHGLPERFSNPSHIY